MWGSVIWFLVFVSKQYCCKFTSNLVLFIDHMLGARASLYEMVILACKYKVIFRPVTSILLLFILRLRASLSVVMLCKSHWVPAQLSVIATVLMAHLILFNYFPFILVPSYEFYNAFWKVNSEYILNNVSNTLLNRHSICTATF